MRRTTITVDDRFSRALLMDGLVASRVRRATGTRTSKAAVADFRPGEIRLNREFTSSNCITIHLERYKLVSRVMPSDAGSLSTC